MTADYPDCPDWCDGRCYDGVGDIWNALGGRGAHTTDGPPLRRRIRRRHSTHPATLPAANALTGPLQTRPVNTATGGNR